MNIFIFTTIFFFLLSIVLTILYVRARKTIKDDKSVLNESKIFNQEIMNALRRLHAENERLNKNNNNEPS